MEDNNKQPNSEQAKAWYDILSEKLTNELIDKYRKHDEQLYYDTFGIPENERAKFHFKEIDPSLYVSPWMGQYGLDVTPVSYNRAENMERAAAYTLAASPEDAERRYRVLVNAKNNNKKLWDATMNTYNAAQLIRQAVETKYPYLNTGITSLYRDGEGQKHHGTGEAVDIAILNTPNQEYSNILNQSVLFPMAETILGESMQQYIDETSGNRYWSHVAVSDPHTPSKYQVPQENKHLFNFNANNNSYTRRDNKEDWYNEDDVNKALEYMEMMNDKKKELTKK